MDEVVTNGVDVTTDVCLLVLVTRGTEVVLVFVVRTNGLVVLNVVFRLFVVTICLDVVFCDVVPFTPSDVVPDVGFDADVVVNVIKSVVS